MTTVFRLADKVEVWGRRVKIAVFDMFQTLAWILEETEPGPSFSHLLVDNLSLFLKEFEHYFPT